MYRHGFQWRRLYVAFDRGLDWRGWLCAVFRLQFAPWSVGKTLHLQAAIGPLFVDWKVL